MAVKLDSLEEVKKHAYAIVEACPDMESFLYQSLLGNPETEDLNSKFKIEAPYRMEYIGHYLRIGDVVKGENVFDGQYPVVVKFRYVWIRQKLFVWWSVSGIYADYNLCLKVLHNYFSSVPEHRHVQGNSNLLHIIHQLVQTN